MIATDELRRVLLDPAQAATLDVHGRTDAAVLVPLYEHEGDVHVVFTRRRDDLRRHAGEISFPGGRQDFPDEDLRATALRESEEEIGLAPSDVELVGALPPTGTLVTGYKIHPFVGVIRPGHEWVPQPLEVSVIAPALAKLAEALANAFAKHVPCTASVCAADRLPLSVPGDGVAVSVFGPAIGLSVQEVTVAIPSAPVAIGVVGSTVPLFTPVANVTGTPGTGLPLASLTITEGGKATAVPAGADWVTGLLFVIDAA